MATTIGEGILEGRRIAAEAAKKKKPIAPVVEPERQFSTAKRPPGFPKLAWALRAEQRFVQEQAAHKASPAGQAERRQGRRIRRIRAKGRSATVLTGSGAGAGLGITKRKNATSQTGATLG